MVSNEDILELLEKQKIIIVDNWLCFHLDEDDDIAEIGTALGRAYLTEKEKQNEQYLGD